MSARRKPYTSRRRALLPLSVRDLEAAGPALLGLSADELTKTLAGHTRAQKWVWLIDALQGEQAIGPECDPRDNSHVGRILADNICRDHANGLLTDSETLRLHDICKRATHPTLESLLEQDEARRAGVTDPERDIIIAHVRTLTQGRHSERSAFETTSGRVARGELEGVRALPVSPVTIKSWLHPEYRRRQKR
ncbi:hypothetical protein AWB68_05697 [Caballeronia choica]|uniref:Uncharacterized protein n=1 Tax=Caballeronia choica TaxID=326476 RepID=A0A158KF09_9BURK|nr:hypothetical protein [Caballeronia choica]SAL79716.1 hypothetical protein AWB68_05697 [Caballeronia choica]